MSNIIGSRDSRLPPLSTSPDSQEYEWQYFPQSNAFSGSNSNQSPTASYPATYPDNHASSAYHLRQSYDDLALINPQNCGSNSTFDDVFRLDRRYSSPYGLSSGPSHTPHVPSPRTYPISANIARGADLRDKARTHRLRSAQGPRRNLQPHCFPVYGRAYCTRKYARHVSTQYTNMVKVFSRIL